MFILLWSFVKVVSFLIGLLLRDIIPNAPPQRWLRPSFKLFRL